MKKCKSVQIQSLARAQISLEDCETSLVARYFRWYYESLHGIAVGCLKYMHQRDASKIIIFHDALQSTAYNPYSH